MIALENMGEVMTNNDKVNDAVDEQPEVGNDVVAHNQHAALNGFDVSTLVDRTQEGLSASSLDMELGRLADSDNKRFGIQFVLRMAAAWSKETNIRFAILGNRNEKLANELMSVREEYAALRAKSEERTKHTPIVSSALLLGSVIASFGFEQIFANNLGIGIGAGLIGVILIVVALYVQRGDGK